MTRTSGFKVSRRKTVSFAIGQQNITAVGDIEKSGQVVRLRRASSFPNGLPGQYLTGQPTAGETNMVDYRYHIIAAATGISVAPVIACTSRMRFVG